MPLLRGLMLSMAALALVGCPGEPPGARGSTAAPREAGPSAAVTSGSRAEAALSVGAFMRVADGPRLDLCIVEGIVTAVDGETVALSDGADAADCTDCTGCAPLHLPVLWTGQPPRLNETVRVEGSVETSDGKLVFVARRLERSGASR